MKKLFCLVLAGLLAVGLFSGCSQNVDTPISKMYGVSLSQEYSE